MAHAKFHDVSLLFRAMHDGELAALVEDIRKHGVREPVITHKGRIVDGRNRWRAVEILQAAGELANGKPIECPTRELNGQDPWPEAQSRNLIRRHLDPAGVAAIRLEAERRFPKLKAEADVVQAEAEARQRASHARAGKAGGRGNKTRRSRDRRLLEAATMAGWYAKQVGVSASSVKRAMRLLRLAPDLFDDAIVGKMTVAEGLREHNRRTRAAIQKQRVEFPSGKYQTVVIDPPWPMEKIERDERPNQVGFDYPTMTVDEIAALPIAKLAEDDCHLYLWTTHRFLPDALRLAEGWGFSYQCLLTWVKNVGFTPFSFMYSTEHVVFARRGGLDLLVKGKRLDFSAPVREHSRKPDEFYALVCDVSPPPRVEMFSREPHRGFAQHGNETQKYDALQAVADGVA